jgi:hypothetical protein
VSLSVFSAQQIAVWFDIRDQSLDTQTQYETYPYLTYINKTGSREITPDGVEVQSEARSDWRDNFYFRKHHFVHLHGGDEFGIMKTPYRITLSTGLLLLNFTGPFLWWKKRKSRLSAKQSFGISNSKTLTKAI